MPRIRFLANSDTSAEKIISRVESLGTGVSCHRTKHREYYEANFPTREMALAAFDECLEHFSDERPEDFIDSKEVALFGG